MKLIAFILITTYVYKISSSKLPLSLHLEDDNSTALASDSSTTKQQNKDSLNTRDIGSDYYGSYMPADYGNLNFFSNLFDSVSRILPTYSQPDPYYTAPAYVPFSTDYSQEQWSTQPWPSYWNQHTSSDPSHHYYSSNTDVPHIVGSENSNYYTNQYQTTAPVTRKISTVFNPGESNEIKHKLVITPDYPDGTGYISIGPSGANKIPGSSSKDGKVYYRF